MRMTTYGVCFSSLALALSVTTGVGCSDDGIGGEGGPTSKLSPLDAVPKTNAFPIAGSTRKSCSDGYGDPRSGGRTHKGVDCFAPLGTALVAVEDGSIRYAQHGGPFSCSAGGDFSGNRVSLTGASGTRYYYGHLKDIYVSDGQPVKKGQTIGTLGSTGNALCSVPHLHFEISIPPTYSTIDPYPVMATWGSTDGTPEVAPPPPPPSPPPPPPFTAQLAYVNDDAQGDTWTDYPLKGSPVGGSASSVVYKGVAYTFNRGADGSLIVYAADNAQGDIWTDYVVAGAPIAGDPQAIVHGDRIFVIARTTTDQIVQYINDNVQGDTWTDYVIPGVAIVGNPQPIIHWGMLSMFARTTTNQLVQYVNDNAQGDTWTDYVIPGAAIVGNPQPIVQGDGITAFARSTKDQLLQYVPDNVQGDIWTDHVIGGEAIGGDPQPVIFNNTFFVFARTTSDQLVQYIPDDVQGDLWTDYITPGTPIAGDPKPTLIGSGMHVFVRARD